MVGVPGSKKVPPPVVGAVFFVRLFDHPVQPLEVFQLRFFGVGRFALSYAGPGGKLPPYLCRGGRDPRLQLPQGDVVIILQVHFCGKTPKELLNLSGRASQPLGFGALPAQDLAMAFDDPGDQHPVVKQGKLVEFPRSATQKGRDDVVAPSIGRRGEVSDDVIQRSVKPVRRVKGKLPLVRI